MANPPTGTVTFLFTDIEGSTALWENYPMHMRSALVRYHELLQSAVETHEGRLFETVGYACRVAFAAAPEALHAALEAQRELFAEGWDEPISLQVRMALHTGVAEERGGGYYGPALGGVARLLSAGHGGQVLMSEATHDLVHDHPELTESRARLLELGDHAHQEERVYQLAIPDLPDRFPPLRTFSGTYGDLTGGDRYRIEDFLGSGGMALVYRAHDERLERKVAIKVLHPRYVYEEEFVERFRREAKSAGKLSHPNIVAVHDQGKRKDGTYYMAMEYLPGGTLGERIKREGSLPPHTAVALTLQIARALETAHRGGIVHRDVKPRNILLSESGEAKIADFGIAKAASSITITTEGRSPYTPAYASPEQKMNRQTTSRSDLYSLGVVLYEMLTGEVPSDAEAPADAPMEQEVGNRPHPPKKASLEVPEELRGITLRLLAEEPEQRYPDAAALREDLERVNGKLGLTGEVGALDALAGVGSEPGAENGARSKAGGSSSSEAASAKPAIPILRRGPRVRALGVIGFVVAVALIGFVWILTPGIQGGANTQQSSQEDDGRVVGQSPPGGSSGNKQLTLGSIIGWTENKAVSNLTKVLMEDELGYEEVQIEHRFHKGQLLRDVAVGNVAAFQDFWLPGDQTFLSRVGNEVELLEPWYEGETKYGIAVPDYMDIQSLEDLDEAGTNEIIVIGPWLYPQFRNEVFPAYNLKNFELVESGTDGRLAELDRAYNAQEPIVFLASSPHWTNAEYDLHYLDDPKDAQGAYRSKIYTAVNEDLASDDPVAYAFLRESTLTEEQFNSLENEIRKANGDPIAGSKAWLEDNQNVVQPWIDAAKQAREA